MCPSVFFCVSSPVPCRAPDRACCIAKRCQRLKVQEKSLQKKDLLSDYQATVAALGSSSLGGEERSGVVSAMGSDLGPKDGILYPLAQYANSDARAGGPGKQHIRVQEAGCERQRGLVGSVANRRACAPPEVNPSLCNSIDCCHVEMLDQHGQISQLFKRSQT